MPTLEFIKFSKEQKGDKYQKRKLSDKIDQKNECKVREVLFALSIVWQW